MARGNFTGSVYHRLLRKMHFMLSTMMVDGGEVYPMAQDHTRNLQVTYMTGNLKMDLNMGKANNIFSMAIPTKDNMLMVFRRDSGCTSGMTAANMREILSKG